MFSDGVGSGMFSERFTARVIHSETLPRHSLTTPSLLSHHFLLLSHHLLTTSSLQSSKLILSGCLKMYKNKMLSNDEMMAVEYVESMIGELIFDLGSLIFGS